MANQSYKANNCVLEIGTSVGSRTIDSQIQVGTTNVTSYVGCVDNPLYAEQGFNLPPMEERVVYTGTVPATVQNLGGTLSEAIGVGNITTQGCSLNFLNTFNNNSFTPGTNADDNKLIYFTLHEGVNHTSINMPFIAPSSTAGGLRFEPYNDASQSANAQGRAIYFYKQVGVDNNVIERSTNPFDIVTPFANNHLLVVGNGADNMDDYTLTHNDLYTDPESFSYYISAYKHSGAWDSSGGSNKPFYWMGGSLDTKTYIGSYEGSLFSKGLGYKANECFQSRGLLGLTSQYFGFENGLSSCDQFEVEISVSQILNATIDVLEGSPHNSIIENTNAGDLRITSPGVYTFCLAALKKTKVWGATATDGGIAKMAGNKHLHWSNGSVNLLEAIAIDNSLPARCTVDYIKITKKDTETITNAVPQFNSNSYQIDDYRYDYLDVFSDDALPLALTYTIGNLKDLTKSKSAYSKTFNIPANKHNNQILHPMLEVGSVKEKIDWQPCRISVDGVIVFKGLMRIEKGVTGKGGQYICHILDDSIDWTSLLNNKEICELAFGDEEPRKKGYDSIIDSWFHSPVDAIENETYHDFRNNPERNIFGGQYSVPSFQPGATNPNVEKDYLYGLVNYGEWHSQSVNTDPLLPHDFSHNSNDFHPAIFAYRLVHKIFNDIGYTLQSNFIESETFKRLVHPYTSGEEYIDLDVYGSEGGQSVTVKQITKFAPGGNFGSNGEVPNGNTRYAYPNPVPGNDPGSNWGGNSSTTGYTAPFAGDYYVGHAVKLYINASFLITGSAYLGTQLMINGQPYGSTPAGGWGFGAINHANDNGVANGLSHTVNTTIFLNQGDVVSWRIIGHNPANIYHMWTKVSHFTFDIYPIVSNTVPEFNVNFTKVLPCLKQKDYLKGITELFNLQWTADRDSRVVTVEPYDDFYGSGKVLDWSKKLDKRTWTDKYIAEELAQNVSFEYKKDSGDKGIESLYAWRETNGFGIYKSYELQNEQRFRKDRLVLGSTVFHSTYRFNNYGDQPNPTQAPASYTPAPNAYKWGDLTWTDPSVNKNNPLMPVIWTGEGGHINGMQRPPYVKNPKAAIRILNYYGVTRCSRYDFVKANGNIQRLGVYPHLGWINGWNKGIAKDDFNLSWDDYDDGTYVSPGLFTKYWKNAYAKMSGDAVIRTCKFNLSAIDINLFDYKDIIHLKIDNVSTYWTVQEIKDYKPNKKELTSVELIEWKQDNNYVAKTTRKRRNTSPVEEETSLKKNLTTIEPITTVVQKSNLSKIDEAITIRDNGDFELYGGELIVEDDNGTICTLVYTDDVDVKKLYLPKEEGERKTISLINPNNPTYNG